MSTTELTAAPTLDLATSLVGFEELKNEANRIAAVITDTAGITITSKEGRDNLYNLAVDGNKLVKRVEARRVELVKPFNDHVKGINDFAKRTLAEPIEKAIVAAKKTIKGWDDEVARQQEEKRRQLAEEQRRRDAEAAEQARLAEEKRQQELAAAQAEADRKRAEEIDAMPPGPEKAAALRALRGETEAKVEEINAKADHEIAHAEIVGHAAHHDLETTALALDSAVGRGRATRWNFRVNDLAALFVARPDLVKVEPRTREILGEIAAGVREIPGLEIFEDSAVVLR